MRGVAHYRRRHGRGRAADRWTRTTSTSSFAGDGRTLASATLASAKPGQASLELAADGGARRIVGQWIDVRFGQDGSTVSGLTVRESVSLTLPGTATEPPRTISSATLTARAKAANP